MERADVSAHYPARLYDRYAERFLGVYDDWVIRRLGQLLRDAPPQSVLLDVGTGTGRLLCRIARRRGFERLRLVGVDYFDEMVEIARRNVQSLGLADRIRVESADVHDLPFATGSVRYVFSRSTVHHWRDPVRALGEIHRVLEPGGLALVYEIRRGARPEALAKFNELRRSAEVEESRTEEKYTPDELWRFVEAAGLAEHALLLAPQVGMMALGMELQVVKPEQPVAARPLSDR